MLHLSSYVIFGFSFIMTSAMTPIQIKQLHFALSKILESTEEAPQKSTRT